MASVALQSKEHRDLLDIVDKLRSQGTDRYVDLPEVLVCGDQSAGKSSVLEAISGFPFPTSDNLCTKFATELVLRRDSTTRVKISIRPGPGRTAKDKERLLSFNRTLGLDKDELVCVIDEAKEAMGLSDTMVFGVDTLRVELSGQTQPHLTIADLPGLSRAGNKDQSVDGAETARSMARTYMKRSRSIILAVVSAKSGLVLQDVIEFTRELDPTGARTMGLITKPDTLDAGSESEQALLRLIQDMNVVFRLGWHILRDRDYKTRDFPSAERDQAEEEPSSQDIWTLVDSTHLGVKSLKLRLSNVLKDQILRQLPSLLQDVESGIKECHNRRVRLGDSRTTIDEQRRYLFRVSQNFSKLMKAAVDGIYNDQFFGSAKTDEGYRKRLRAVVQNTLTKFEEDMCKNGEKRAIIECPEDGDVKPDQISRADYMNEVNDLMKRSKGCELPGTFNPLIINELFKEHCQPWRDITSRLKGKILEAVYWTTWSILEHVAVVETANGISRIISNGIEMLRNDLDRKMIELFDPHYIGNAITYNHYLRYDVQKAQSGRQRRDIERILKNELGLTCSEHSITISAADIAGLLTTLVQYTTANVEHYAASLAVDYMQAYYTVSPQRRLSPYSQVPGRVT